MNELISNVIHGGVGEKSVMLLRLKRMMVRDDYSFKKMMLGGQTSPYDEFRYSDFVKDLASVSIGFDIMSWFSIVVDVTSTSRAENITINLHVTLGGEDYTCVLFRNMPATRNMSLDMVQDFLGSIRYRHRDNGDRDIFNHVMGLTGTMPFANSEIEGEIMEFLYDYTNLSDYMEREVE